MTTSETSQPRSRGAFVWLVAIAALAVVLVGEVSLARRMSSLEQLMIQAAQERQAHESRLSAAEDTPNEGRASIRRSPRTASGAQRAGDTPETVADSLLGSGSSGAVLSRIDTAVSTLQSQFQHMTNVLSPPVAMAVATVVPDYDPTLPPNPNDAEEETRKDRAWGPEQATGPPNTIGGGDSEEAWAPLQTDGGPEWLWVTFERLVEVERIRIRENHNPGAIYKVTGIINEQQVVLWEGVATKRPGPRDFSFPVTPGNILQSVVVHLDTRRVTGWNEIDAVELIGRDGSRQWAVSASASSFFGAIAQE